MKNKILKIGILAMLIMIILPVGQAFGAEEDDFKYKVLAPLPGVAEKVGDTTTLEKYIPAVFNLAIGLSAVFAVLMIVLGGVQYITTDAIMGKQEGKERIKNAVIGLILVISAWLILSTINPNLLNINLNIEEVTTSSPAIGGTLAPTSYLSEYITNTCPNCGPINNNLVYNLSQEYINNLNCINCVPLHKDIGSNNYSNRNVDVNTGDRLHLLNRELPKDISWYVSEGYPPVVEHQNSCHQSGTCVDANFGRSTEATPENINTFINTASQQGLTAVYEVSDPSQIPEGVPSNSVQVVPGINNNHFSVYNNEGYP